MRIFSGAKVLVVSDIGEERRYSTEVRKERSEGTLRLKYRRGARRLLCIMKFNNSTQSKIKTHFIKRKRSPYPLLGA